MKRDGTVVLLSREPDDKGRFSVFVDRYCEMWSIDRIKEHVADGGDLTEREAA